MSNRYTTAFKRMQAALAPICAKYGIGKIHFYLDAIWCFVRYGVTPNEYVGFAFYKLSGLARKQFYTARHAHKYDKLFNDPQYADTFWHKEKTNATYRDFLRRDWLYVPDANDAEIDSFLKTHNKVIVKPQNLSSGRGIFVYNGEPTSALKETPCLLEEFVCQHPLMAAINPSSVNTIRVYTLLKIKCLPPPHNWRFERC